MTIKTRVNQRAFNALLVIILFIAAAIFAMTANAQVVASIDGLPVTQSTAVKNIRYVEGLDLTARAIPLNKDVNSAFEELKPTVSPDGKRVYFSRTFHPDNTVGTENNEDIWYAEYDKATETWSFPTLMAGELNNDGPNYINNVSVTGDTLILGNRYLKKGRMRAGLSYTVNVNGQWSVPANIDIENDYNISSHSQSYVDLSTGVIIRAIQRVETIGERDLYVSFWDGKKATEPINMGTVINTELEESSPYLAADNKTLYFASKGHKGHGGMDIYVTQRLDETWTNWSEPENLGPAINGPMDDEFFSLTHCGKFAIFSKQVSVHNVDIYRISLSDLFDNITSPAHQQYKIEPGENSALTSL